MSRFREYSPGWSLSSLRLGSKKMRTSMPRSISAQVALVSWSTPGRDMMALEMGRARELTRSMSLKRQPCSTGIFFMSRMADLREAGALEPSAALTMLQLRM